LIGGERGDVIDSVTRVYQSAKMMRWIYPLILLLALPLVWLRLAWRARREPEYGKRRAERFGHVAESVRTGPIWFHTVSAGETIAAAPLIREVTQLLARTPDAPPVLVTTMTPTGSAQVIERLGDLVDHCYAPYDFGFGVRRFYAQVRPRLLVLMETELWPNLIAEAHAHGVPVLLVNARLSARSAAGYAKLGGLTRRMLSQVDMIACQTQDHSDRFESLGAPHTSVLGSVKFDVELPADFPAQVHQLGSQLGLIDSQVWIAASTHPGEDEIVLAVFTRLREQFPQLRLLLVPRHPVRADEVAALVTGYSLARQSELCAGDMSPPTVPADVIIGDVMGSLLLLYGLAGVAFIGGSLVPLGGHNPIEPALCSVPAMSGPHQFNFTQAMQALEAAGAHVTVADGDELAAQLSAWLSEPAQAQGAGAAGGAVLTENRGAQARILNLLREHLTKIGIDL